MPRLNPPGASLIQYAGALSLPSHPSFSYKFRVGTYTAGQTPAFNISAQGDISSWSGFTTHTYTLQGDRVSDGGVEGLLNYINANASTLLPHWPNGSSLINNSGGSVNLGGTP